MHAAIFLEDHLFMLKVNSISGNDKFVSLNRHRTESDICSTLMCTHRETPLPPPTKKSPPALTQDLCEYNTQDLCEHDTQGLT